MSCLSLPRSCSFLRRLPLLTANWELLSVFWEGRHFSHERGQGSSGFTQVSPEERRSRRLPFAM